MAPLDEPPGHAPSPEASDLLVDGTFTPHEGVEARPARGERAEAQAGVAASPGGNFTTSSPHPAEEGVTGKDHNGGGLEQDPVAGAVPGVVAAVDADGSAGGQQASSGSPGAGLAEDAAGGPAGEEGGVPSVPQATREPDASPPPDTAAAAAATPEPTAAVATPEPSATAAAVPEPTAAAATPEPTAAGDSPGDEDRAVTPEGADQAADEGGEAAEDAVQATAFDTVDDGVDEEEDEVALTPGGGVQINYANAAAGAEVLTANGESRGKKALLKEDKDSYFMTPCEAHKWFDVRLSDSVQVTRVVLATHERHCSTIRRFRLLGAASYPTRRWFRLGNFTADDSRGEQGFDMERGARPFVKYLRLRWDSHHRSQYVCTLSGIKVFGHGADDTMRLELNRLNKGGGPGQWEEDLEDDAELDRQAWAGAQPDAQGADDDAAPGAGDGGAAASGAAGEDTGASDATGEVGAEAAAPSEAPTLLTSIAQAVGLAPVPAPEEPKDEVEATEAMPEAAGEPQSDAEEAPLLEMGEDPVAEEGAEAPLEGDGAEEVGEGAAEDAPEGAREQAAGEAEPQPAAEPAADTSLVPVGSAVETEGGRSDGLGHGEAPAVGAPAPREHSTPPASAVHAGDADDGSPPAVEPPSEPPAAIEAPAADEAAHGTAEAPTATPTVAGGAPAMPVAPLLGEPSGAAVPASADPGAVAGEAGQPGAERHADPTASPTDAPTVSPEPATPGRIEAGEPATQASAAPAGEPETPPPKPSPAAPAAPTGPPPCCSDPWRHALGQQPRSFWGVRRRALPTPAQPDAGPEQPTAPGTSASESAPVEPLLAARQADGEAADPSAVAGTGQAAAVAAPAALVAHATGTATDPLQASSSPPGSPARRSAAHDGAADAAPPGDEPGTATGKTAPPAAAAGERDAGDRPPAGDGRALTPPSSSSHPQPQGQAAAACTGSAPGAASPSPEPAKVTAVPPAFNATRRTRQGTQSGATVSKMLLDHIEGVSRARATDVKRLHGVLLELQAQVNAAINETHGAARGVALVHNETAAQLRRVRARIDRLQRNITLERRALARRGMSAALMPDFCEPEQIGAWAAAAEWFVVGAAAALGSLLLVAALCLLRLTSRIDALQREVLRLQQGAAVGRSRLSSATSDD